MRKMAEEIEAVEESAGKGQTAELEVVQLKEELASRESELSSLREQLRASVERYRAQVLASAPEVPEELIQGETVAEIDASVEKARQMVERVKQQLEAHITTVPAGAPPRRSSELSELSPREKIAYALGGQQR
jgi:hypothetical protein